MAKVLPPLLLATIVATVACGAATTKPFGRGGSDGSDGSGGVTGGTGGNGIGGAPPGGGSGGATGTGGTSAGSPGGATGTGARGGGGFPGGGLGGSSTGSGSGGSGGVATGGGGAANPCPADPQSTPACTREGLICEYGTDPRPECRNRATCTAGSWSLTEVRCVVIPPAVGGCPASRDAAQGRACSPDAAICPYDGLNCVCASCPPNGPVGCTPNAATLTWYCDAPNADPACPAATPRLGSACTSEGKQCNYKCGTEGSRLCRVGVWTAIDGLGCPRGGGAAVF